MRDFYINGTLWCATKTKVAKSYNNLDPSTPITLLNCKFYSKCNNDQRDGANRIISQIYSHLVEINGLKTIWGIDIGTK